MKKEYDKVKEEAALNDSILLLLSLPLEELTDEMYHARVFYTNNYRNHPQDGLIHLKKYFRDVLYTQVTKWRYNNEILSKIQEL